MSFYIMLENWRCFWNLNLKRIILQQATQMKHLCIFVKISILMGGSNVILFGYVTLYGILLWKCYVLSIS